jgi:hypothetical protein
VSVCVCVCVSGMYGRRKKKCPVPKSNFMMYMDEGVMHYRVGHYQRAVISFDQVQVAGILLIHSTYMELHFSMRLTTSFPLLSLYFPRLQADSGWSGLVSAGSPRISSRVPFRLRLLCSWGSRYARHSPLLPVKIIEYDLTSGQLNSWDVTVLRKWWELLRLTPIYLLILMVGGNFILRCQLF